MWHASAAPYARAHLPILELRRLAFTALAGVGEKAPGQWVEISPRAYHLRRRLSVSEQAAVGAAIDCRGSLEGQRRLELFRGELPPQALTFAQMELRSTPGGMADAHP